MGVLREVFERCEKEGFVFRNREAYVASVLLAAERILDWGSDGSRVEIGVGGIIREGGTEGEWVTGIKRLIAEKAVDRAMYVVAAGLGDNVDRSASGSAEVGAVITTVNLEFLDVILVDG